MIKQLKHLAILGSTGSIGQQALDIVRAFPERFRVAGLAAGENTGLLAKQVAEFRPRLVYYEGKAKSLPITRYQFVSMEDMVTHPDVHMVLVATSGKAGLSPTLAALKAGKTVALANKESLVMAGEIVTREAKANSARILPVDSEHSAIWQCLEWRPEEVARIILTASGGPFYGYSPEQLSRVTAEEALQHPSWRMGKKVTIDSASLMNKGLEVIEAHWLFDMPFDKIQVLIQPQSIIHSMVEFVDGAVKAQLSSPDMRLPIQYALSYPERWANPQLPRLDWTSLNRLTFDRPDFRAFPSLRIAIEAGKKGGTYPAVLCGADEVAVGLFLAGRIKFTDITGLVEQALSEHRVIAHPSLEEILAADAWAREKVMMLVTGVIS
ncbi:MAG: 1-deoxy-D-xylulose-5-phosphate reductoisomerase [Chloroflexi bacterium]|nr:1-deoxy-D-xylulose-5-phosphate reductoisomerase [Chloroflexota bacterium]